MKNYSDISILYYLDTNIRISEDGKKSELVSSKHHISAAQKQSNGYCYYSDTTDKVFELINENKGVIDTITSEEPLDLKGFENLFKERGLQKINKDKYRITQKYEKYLSENMLKTNADSDKKMNSDEHEMESFKNKLSDLWTTGLSAFVMLEMCLFRHKLDPEFKRDLKEYKFQIYESLNGIVRMMSKSMPNDSKEMVYALFIHSAEDGLRTINTEELIKNLGIEDDPSESEFIKGFMEEFKERIETKSCFIDLVTYAKISDLKAYVKKVVENSKPKK